MVARPHRRAASAAPGLTRLAWVCAAAVLIVMAATPAARAGDFPMVVRDALGRDVQIPAPPKRIISLAPSVTEILFALGLDAEIVGVTRADDYPPDKVQSRARVGGVIINLERVVALQPNLIIGMPSLQQDQLVRLATLRLPVLAVDAASVDETIAQIRLLGRVTGRGSAGEALAKSLEARVQVVQPRVRRTVYIEVWYEPVIAAGGSTLIHDLTRRAGGANIFGDLRGYPQIPVESVLTRNPQVIFLLYAGRDQLVTRAGWRAIDAIRSNRVYELPASLVSRPGPRIADGLALVSRLLGALR